MDENEVIGADAEAESGTESETEGAAPESSVVVQNITVDSSALAAEVAVLETKLDALSGQATVLTDKVTGCYCMLLILAVLGLRNVFRSIIRKVRGGNEDV